MKRVVVSEKAIRELVREALNNKSFVVALDENTNEEPVNVSDVVDPVAAITDPGNENYKPNNSVEFQVVIKALSDDLPSESIPGMYEKIIGAIKHNKNKIEDKMKKKDNPVESLVRNHIRKMLREGKYFTEAPVKIPKKGSAPRATTPVDDDYAEFPPRENSTVGDDGDTFDEIAKELGFSISGAKQAVDKAVAKAQWVGSMQLGSPEELEIIVLQSMNDYINMLKKTGELTPADVQLLRTHPDIVRELDGFREFLDRAVRKSRKQNPVGSVVRKGDIQWPDRPGDER